MLGYVFLAVFVAGLATGVFLSLLLVRHGMALHERLEVGIKEGRTVFGEYEGAPLEYAATGDTPDDLEVDSD